MTAVRAAVWVAAASAGAGALHAALNRRRLRHLRPGSRRPLRTRVSVLVPARDEAAHVAGLVADLTAQQGVPDLEIIVLDDDSTDPTAAVARAAAGTDPRVRVLRSTDPLPPGWLGKPYACHRLSQEATGEVLVFVDADVRLHPGALAAAVCDLADGGGALLSAWPRQLTATHLAALVQPLQQWSWLTTLPLGLAAGSARASMAAANGQFLLFTRTGYERIGGHRAVADRVLEDICLARAVKRAGLRADLADASAVAQCLMYDNDRDLVAGYTKSLWAAFGGPVRGVLATGVLATGYALPMGYAVLGRHAPTRWVGLAGYGAAVANRAVTDRATGTEVWPSAAEHPVALVCLFLMALQSARRHARGTLRWRGRPVAVPPDRGQHAHPRRSGDARNGR